MYYISLNKKKNTIWGVNEIIFKGIVPKLAIKFWMCQKCKQKKNKKKKEPKQTNKHTNKYLLVLRNDYKHIGYDNNYNIHLAISF
jgi:ribosomal protein L37AE/L43A